MVKTFKLLFMLPVISACALPVNAQTTQAPHVSAAYTTWDSSFLYAAFDVRTTSVFSTNTSIISEPQQDDDVEVFIETDGAQSAKVRTSATYQMAVSAAGGAYFSVGNGTKIPTAKAIYDYKFAPQVNGDINKKDGAKGFTIELAIPWRELGLTKAPEPESVFAFNVICRHRESLNKPASIFYSLSPNVKSRDDVQSPEKWIKIKFLDNSLKDNGLTPKSEILCAKVIGRPPLIDGQIVSGEYSSLKFSFGDAPIAGDAPTVDEEPNVGAKTGTPLPVVDTPNSWLPTVKILPEQKNTEKPKIDPKSTKPSTKVPQSKDQSNPLIFLPNTPNAAEDMLPPDAPTIDAANPVPLPPQPRAFQQVMAVYTLQNASYLDHPQESFTPKFSPLSEQYVIDQYKNARISGIETLLTRIPDNPASRSELMTMVQALETMEARGEDFPKLAPFLVADQNYASSLGIPGANIKPAQNPKTAASDEKTLSTFFSIVPTRFRAQTVAGDGDGNRQAYIVVADHAASSSDLEAALKKSLNENCPLLIANPTSDSQVTARFVSPGGAYADSDQRQIVGRANADTYQTTWGAAVKNNPDWIIINSWNDFANGTEIALSREYADRYANLTRMNIALWRGEKPWAAAFLSNDAPSRIVQSRIYTTHVRIENTGASIWRKLQSFSLSYRWCDKDGRVVDASAPRIALQDDVAPGDSYTATIGITALNGFGKQIDPGDYTLVIDMIQGQSRWFSYAGNIPLKIPVTIVDEKASEPNTMRVLSINTPVFHGLKNKAIVQIRNEGGQTWKKGEKIAILKQISGASNFQDGAFSTPISAENDVIPGSIATCAIEFFGVGDSNQNYFSTDYSGYTLQSKEQFASAPLTTPQLGGQIMLSDLNRHLQAGQNVDVKLIVRNNSQKLWKKNDYKIAYQWSDLNGVPLSTEPAGFAYLPRDIEPGSEAVALAKIQTPEFAGRYIITWGMALPSGEFEYKTNAYQPERFLLVQQIWAVGGAGDKAIPVDLAKYFDTRAVLFEGETGSGIDGAGNAFPAEMMPPNGTKEADANPFLIGAPGPELYPAPYSTASENGTGRISFLFPSKVGNDAVGANGQTISIPAGKYKSAHILAVTTAESTEKAIFTLTTSDGGSIPATLDILPWRSSTASAAQFPYASKNGVITLESPTPALGEYDIAAPTGKKVVSITLPKSSSVKVFAITLEK
jgi:hypothetical protein